MKVTVEKDNGDVVQFEYDPIGNAGLLLNRFIHQIKYEDNLNSIILPRGFSNLVITEKEN